MKVFDQLGIDIGYVVLGIAGAIVLLLIFTIILFVKHRKLKKKYNKFMEGQNAKSLEKIMQNRFDDIDKIKEHMFETDERLESMDKFLLKTYKKMAVVKYDAFREMGGNMSFVLALLSETNDGFVLNTMHSSREGCYTYIKRISKGQCDTVLSEEEKEALEEAMKQ